MVKAKADYLGIEPEEAIRLVREYYDREWAAVTGGNPGGADQFLIDQFNRSKPRERLSQVAQATELSLGSLRILDIGSGFGGVVIEGRRQQFEIYGVEPKALQVEITRKRVEMRRMPMPVSQGAGEALPFKDSTFDLVVSFQVLEHTANPARVIREAIRVLIPGGILYFAIPNYHSFWEGHYCLPWMPWFNKPIAKLYVKLMGRDSDWMDHLTFVTPGKIRRILSTIQNVEVLDWGQQLWVDRMEGQAGIPEWGQTRKITRWVKLGQRLKLTWPAVLIGRRLELYYPIILICQKH